MGETYEFLKECGIFYPATDEDGQPRVRPFGAVDLFETGATSRPAGSSPFPGR